MRICITGKPCSGKSTAIGYIKEAGYNVFVADEYVHEIYKQGNIGYKLIKRHFGSKYVNDKEVNRKALGSLVFSDKKALNKLNNLIQPVIKKAILNLDENKTWFIELATYLFYPEIFNDCFDKIILIFSKENWKKQSQNAKFCYLKKIPTIFVENSQKSVCSILNIDNKICQSEPLNVDFFVENSSSKNYLKNNILKICKLLSK